MKLLSILLVAGVTTFAANAATINVGAGFGAAGIVPVFNSTVLAPGSFYFQAGTYTTVPTITGPESLLAAVNLLSAYGNPVNPSGTTGSKLAGSFTDNTAGQSDKTIYFVVGNAASRAASTAFAIFSMAAGTKTPADNTQPTPVPITMSAFNQIVPLSGAGSTVDAATDQLVLAVAIPEPSTMFLGALGALGLLRRRR